MPDLIVIRLHPSKPISALNFTKYLDNLTITAFDISFDHLEGEQIGQPATLSNSRIAQNFSYELDKSKPSDPLAQTLEMHAIGTAIIDVPSERKEYDLSDIRLKIERNGKEIIARSVRIQVVG